MLPRKIKHSPGQKARVEAATAASLTRGVKRLLREAWSTAGQIREAGVNLSGRRDPCQVE